MMLVVITFFGYFIAPTFRKLLSEMGIAWQPTSAIESRILHPVLWLGLAILALVFVAALIGGSSRFQRWLRRKNPFAWGTNSLTKAVAPVLRMLAVNLRSGRPMVGLLSSLAKYHHQANLRQRLLVARNEIEQGMDPWESLEASRVLNRQERQALQSCNDAESHAWILQKLADQREFEVEKGRRLVWTIANPLVVLALGGVVFWVAYSVIGSVYGLVQALA
jgi:type II secretory pathway component PulF